MRIFFGNPLQEPDPIGFEYMYRDIYKPFFKKATRANHAFYVPQRGRNAACEFPVEKEANEKRIFLIGGSVVNDWCEGGGKDNILYFESALRKEFPGNDFKVINCGMDGYDSYREYLVVRQILSYQPDLIVIMSGNNEQFNYGSNNLKIYAINKFLRRSWVYRKSQEAIFKVTRRPTNLPGKKARLENFRNNLTRMLEKGRARNVPVILCTLPVDFRDSPPRFSFLYPLDEQFILAQFLLYSGDYSNAIAEFDQFLKSNPDNSPGLYFMGKCFDMAADYKKAKDCYLRSLEPTAGCWDRANPSSNMLIRRLCAENNAYLVDLDKRFCDLVPFGLLDTRFFFDYCHWWHEYYIFIADCIIFEIKIKQILGKMECLNGTDGYLPATSVKFKVLSIAEKGKEKDLVPDISKLALWEIARTQSEFSETALSLFEKLYLINPDKMSKLINQKSVLLQSLVDGFNYLGYFYKSPGEFQKYWAFYLYHIGEAYRRLRLSEDAIRYFEEAIAADRRCYLPYLGKALVYYARKDLHAAFECIKKAEELSSSQRISLYKRLMERRNCKLDER